jgi:transposase
MALRDIARGACASSLCKPLGRHVTTVLKWVHDFNERGPQALIYQHSGGSPSQKERLAPLIQEALDRAQQAAAQSKKRFIRR